MIVVDTHVLVYFLLPTKQSAMAEALMRRDGDWAAPSLWRSEFRNVLAAYMRQRLLNFEQARALQAEAESIMNGREYDIDSARVLELVRDSECSAYDCEFIALAERLGVPLCTEDKHLLRAFPDRAVALGKS